jgi:hypothetical protein
VKNPLIRGLAPWAIVFFGSLVGPAIWQLWVANANSDVGPLVEHVLHLLWPTLILALGSSDLSTLSIVSLVLTNSALYMVFAAAGILVLRLVRAPAGLGFFGILVIPVLVQRLFAGGASKGSSYQELFISLLYYTLLAEMARRRQDASNRFLAKSGGI